MTKLILIVYFLNSFLLSQIIPTDMLNKVDVGNIPNQIPIINTDETNILFQNHAYKEYRENGTFSYLKLHSNYEGNYQINITQAYLPEEAYFAFFDQIQNTIYGPYTNMNGSIVFPSVLNGKEIIMIYFEPYNTSFDGSFIIEKIESIENIIYPTEGSNYKIKNKSL